MNDDAPPPDPWSLKFGEPFNVGGEIFFLSFFSSPVLLESCSADADAVSMFFLFVVFLLPPSTIMASNSILSSVIFWFPVIHRLANKFCIKYAFLLGASVSSRFKI